MENADVKPAWRTVAACAAAVFVLAVLIRLPSCYESFWIDELHTAWAIWGDLGDVAPRAELGNQTPFYFWLMWFWKQLVGESEVALRLSSVLAVSFGSALLVIAVTASTGRLSSGLLAGLLLAVESNAIFFGTEFRPFAWLMPLAVVAMWAGSEKLNGRERVKPATLRFVFVGSTCVAALLQPTSLVAFGTLAVAITSAECVLWFWTRDMRIQLHVTDLATLFVFAVTVLLMFDSVLHHAWEHRANWKAFASATSHTQLWIIWPWGALVIVPGVIGLFTIWKRDWRAIMIALLPLAVAITVTGIFFVTSFLDFVSLWHRRYFIAVLPMFAWFAGAWATSGLPSKSRLAWSLAGLMSLGLVYEQGTVQRWGKGRLRLVVRGEGWREAIAWVNGQKATDDVVWLDSGLIEARVFSRSEGFEVQPSQSEWAYLAYPVSGPYELPNAKVASPAARWGAMRNDRWSPMPAAGARLWIISRSHPSTVRQWCREFQRWERTDPLRPYGRVQIALLRRR